MHSEKAMAPHPSTLAWKIPWTEEPDGLQSMGSRKVGHDWATSLSLFTFTHWRRKWQPTPVLWAKEFHGLSHCYVWQKGILIHCWWECKLVQSLRKAVRRFLKKLKLWSSNSTSQYLKETKPLIWKDTCTPMFIAALFIIVKIQNEPKCPSTDEWIKMWYRYMHRHTHINGILLLLLLSRFSRVRLCAPQKVRINLE